MAWCKTYHVYLVTSELRTVLCVGVTNDLEQRVIERNLNGAETFTGSYNSYILVHYECFRYINYAVRREKAIKTWSRMKKHALIGTTNPAWNNLNYSLFGRWPPVRMFHSKGQTIEATHLSVMSSFARHDRSRVRRIGDVSPGRHASGVDPERGVSLRSKDPPP